MNIRSFSWEQFNRVPVVGIVRGLSIPQVQSILPLYLEAGLTTIEITMNTPDAPEIIRYAADQYGEQLNIGAGTVCDTADFEVARSAGAGFIVTPVLDEQVIQACVASGIPVFPGAFTPTEIFKAWKLGASMVKVYPASSLGVQYIKDIKAPLNHIKLLPTGGVDISNMHDFFHAGASGVGIGSHLFDLSIIRSGNWAALKDHFCRFSNSFINTSQQTLL